MSVPLTPITQRNAYIAKLLIPKLSIVNT